MRSRDYSLSISMRQPFCKPVYERVYIARVRTMTICCWGLPPSPALCVFGQIGRLMDLLHFRQHIP